MRFLLRPPFSPASGGPPFPPAPSRRGFTLVELLVVVAIVGVLAALLIPAAQRAVLTARMTKTVGYMRQMGIAMGEYVGDNDGKLPGPANVAVYPYGRKIPLPGDTPHLGAYLAPYLGAAENSVAGPASSFPVKALQCPLLSQVAQNTPGVANYVMWDYPYNNPNNRFGGGTIPLTSFSIAATEPYQPLRLAAITSVARGTPFLSTADRQIWAGNTASLLPAAGAYNGERVWLFLDGGIAVNNKSALWTR